MSFLSHPLVVAIDFGTTYSGWAYSTKEEFKNSPLKIHTRHWQSGNHVSDKAPTTILFQPDGITVEAFGYDAESKYAELAQEEEHTNWFYFKRFKMKIYENEELSIYTMLQDERNKSLPALTVFSAAIRYLKDDLLNNLNKTMKGAIRAEDILWILTVPAIWDDRAKEFMRQASSFAGIHDNNLLLALEPEAASLCCRLLPVQTMYGADCAAILATFKTGSRYMILDAGGGTIDITIHEVTSNGHLKELCAANGGAWGGTSIDRSFEHFLFGLLGPDVLQCFKNDYADDYLEFFRTFETKKRDKMTNIVVLRIPASLGETFEKKKYITLSAFLSSLKFGGTIKDWFKDQVLNVYLVTGSHKTTLACSSVYEKMFREEMEFQLEKNPRVYFRQFLEELVGVLVYDKFCVEQPDDHQRLVESFQMQVELKSISRAFGVQLSLPDSLIQLYTKLTGKDFNSKLSLQEHLGPASLIKDKMKLKSSVWVSFFNYSVRNIVDHISQLLEKGGFVNLESIVMVGGFSECQLLQDAIRSKFPTIKVIIPADAGLAVLKGAVIFGHDSSLICQRICKRTYGVEMIARFIEGRHPPSKKVIIEGDELCKAVFDKHVEIGQTVTLNERTTLRNYRAAKEEDSYITFTVYASTSKYPEFVDDTSCTKLGTVEIPIMDRSVPLADRCFTFNFIFGNTELKLEAKENRTGQTLEAKIDLLGQH
ncbi:hypothetical protein CHS0354_040526 [Potamilus streckersoni]|uniref:Uncharacterized protein n=1 Tax=Potamilus streckersoni TaxID=2493646 RepID=A0AAE0TKX6_9BIVA|nr:hypothetical protein CHS0354_040526 [Potamilus streckersoni]